MEALEKTGTKEMKKATKIDHTEENKYKNTNNTIENKIIRIQRKKIINDIDILHPIFKSDFIIGTEISDLLFTDGICFIQNKFIKKILINFNKKELYLKSTELFGTKIDCNILKKLFFGNSFSECLKYFFDANDVIALHTEVRYPNSCYVGKIIKCNPKFIYIKTISPEGLPQENYVKIKISEITMLEYNTRYLLTISHLSESLKTHTSSTP